MNPNNSGFIVEDQLNSDFTTDPEISNFHSFSTPNFAKNIQQQIIIPPNSNEQNVDNQSGSGIIPMIWQMGKEIGKLKKDLMANGKENGQMKDEMAKMEKAFEELKKVEKF